MNASICGRVGGGVLGLILGITASVAQDKVVVPPIITQQQAKSTLDWSTRYTAPLGRVIALETGWHDDTMSITLDPSVPFVNSSRLISNETCPITTGGYALDPKDPGVKAHEAVLLAALIAGKKVRLLINQCAFGKPRVIAVGIAD